jgi:hypothetical protein
MRAALERTRFLADVQRSSLSLVMRQMASAARVIELKARHAVSHGDGPRRAGLSSTSVGVVPPAG